MNLDILKLAKRLSLAQGKSCGYTPPRDRDRYVPISEPNGTDDALLWKLEYDIAIDQAEERAIEKEERGE